MTARPLALAAAALALAAAVSGCTTLSYYTQAIGGHLDVMRRAEPVGEALASETTPAPTRAKLERAVAIRDYASGALGLPDNGSYRRYADIGRPYVVWNVFAAPELEVRAEESCFPVAGCVTYRGYYGREDAERAAADLRARGFDVFVGGVPAYSTLGWFDDPLLNTFIHYPDPELARLVFHELAHQVVYVKGDTTFNESFAVAVEEEGVRRWLASRGTPEEAQRYERRQAMRAQFIDLVTRYRAKLAKLYAEPVPDADKRAGKAQLFAEMKSDYAALKAGWGGFAGYDPYFADPNNAFLASIATYNELVPAFRALLAQEGGDLPRFYAAARALADLPAAERDARLAALAQPEVAASAGSAGR
ncbi:MAG: aminopeptidase [Burkholderiales bacterium]|jgi:predicted aminopeptidase|nr:aminopeptidase [Burkholderiales bacterium]